MFPPPPPHLCPSVHKTQISQLGHLAYFEHLFPVMLMDQSHLHWIWKSEIDGTGIFTKGFIRDTLCPPPSLGLLRRHRSLLSEPKATADTTNKQ